MLFLHGAGDRGTDVWNVTRLGLPRLLAGAPDLTNAELAAAHEVAAHFIVVAPQCPHFEVWDERLLLQLLDSVGPTLKVEPSRVYLIGLSMGGFGAWSLGLRHPQRFAALVAICGGGRLADILEAERTQKAALQRLGIWAFHGAKDSVVPLEESQRMVDALKKAGVRDVRLTVYPECEHDAWSEAFAQRELYAWLLRHAR
jgi:predicted peptidase